MVSRLDPRLVVALDVDTILHEEELLEKLKGTIEYYKVGLRLFTAHGKRAVDLVHQYGGKVFLDLKLLDIPQTVAHTVHVAQRFGVYSLSLHLWGGPDMVKAAAHVYPRPKLWGVTILTSLQDKDLKFFHSKAKVDTMVHDLARMGLQNGVEGIICSGWEVEHLKKALGNEVCFITPGVRPQGQDPHDQKRPITPTEAARLGIQYAVIGRPITQAPDPLRAAQDIVKEMKHDPHPPLSLKGEGIQGRERASGGQVRDRN